MIIETTLDTDTELIDEDIVTKTYKVSSDNIQGYIDNIEALQQSIYKEINTEKYEYPIYSYDYGIELENLIGMDIDYVKVEFKRRIKECLLRDERIQSVDNFSFNVSGDGMLCKFDVVSIYGEIVITKEVNV